MSKVHLLLSPSLCPFLVVPANSRDNTLDYVASLHHGNRLPVWCWSHPNTGVSLTRGGAPSIDDPSEAPDPRYSNCLLCITGALGQLLGKNAADYRTKPFCVHTQAGLEALCQFKGTKLQFVALKRHNSLSVCLSVCVSSYMYAVSMARNIGHQIENKGTATLDITRTCGTVWDLRSAFSNMRDLSMPGRPHPPHSSEVQYCHRFTKKFSWKLKNYACPHLHIVEQNTYYFVEHIWFRFTPGASWAGQEVADGNGVGWLAPDGSELPAPGKDSVSKPLHRPQTSFPSR